MGTSSSRLVAIAVAFAAVFSLYPSATNATTVTVTVGNGGFFFSPSSVTIHPGDTVLWTWSSSGHSSTSGTPGSPNGIWDSTVLNENASFMHTDPHGVATTVSFQYGPTTSYGHTTAVQSQNGSTYRNISANVSGLASHTTIHFRMVATNSAGTNFGNDSTFTAH